MDHFILLVKYLSNHMHFITNGYKHFSKTNSSDPRQRVPLQGLRLYCFIVFVIKMCYTFRPILFTKEVLYGKCSQICVEQNPPIDWNPLILFVFYPFTNLCESLLDCILAWVGFEPMPFAIQKARPTLMALLTISKELAPRKQWIPLLCQVYVDSVFLPAGSPRSVALL